MVGGSADGVHGSAIGVHGSSVRMVGGGDRVVGPGAGVRCTNRAKLGWSRRVNEGWTTTNEWRVRAPGRRARADGGALAEHQHRDGVTDAENRSTTLRVAGAGPRRVPTCRQDSDDDRRGLMSRW